MTIYGPSSENYDQAIDPILITDWAHMNTSEAWRTKKFGSDSILLNGTGQYTRSESKLDSCKIPAKVPKYTITFQKVGGYNP